MKILIIGSAGRERAMAMACKRSPQRSELFCFGPFINPGIRQLTSDYAVGDICNREAVVAAATAWNIDLALIGPEAALEVGLSDALWEAHIPTMGPYKDLAQIETSKSFARNLMQEHQIAGLPRYRRFNGMGAEVREWLNVLGEGCYVIKADGLMGGKGVKIAGEQLFSFEEAMQFCQEISAVGQSFVIEEKLQGHEFTFMCFSDGIHLLPMPLVQDHKRAYPNDKGPNTGGMGSYSDANHRLPFLSAEEAETAFSINQAVVSALQKTFAKPYIGILYGSFMATSKGIFVIEFNARFGDPEALNVLSVLETDFIALCQALVQGSLDRMDVKFMPKATVCKYAVPEGYPEAPLKNFPVDVSAVSPDHLYFASVHEENGRLLAQGSRTAAYVGIAESIFAAEKKAEKEISAIKGPLFHREDIGTEALISKLRLSSGDVKEQDTCELLS